MKMIHIFFSVLNFTYSNVDRKKLQKSLSHSLRLSSEQDKSSQWYEELAQSNILTRHGNTVVLNSLDQNERSELLNNLLPDPKVAKREVKLRQRAESKRKLKNGIASERKNGNHEAADLFQDWLNFPDDQAIPPRYWHRVAARPPVMWGKKQRMRMLAEYHDLHNMLCGAEPRINQTYLQEVVFTIPRRWEIGTNIMPLQMYIDIVSSFYRHYFPDYEIKLGLGHHDERRQHVSTGAHCHLYISTLNQRTQKRDLLKQQYNEAVKFQRLFGPVHWTSALPVEEKEKGRKYKNALFEFDRMFYAFINNYYLNTLGLNAEFSPEVERRSQQRKLMNIQASLPKSQRSFNLESMVREELEKERAELDKMQIQLSTTEKQLAQTQDRLIMAEIEYDEELVQFEVLKMQHQKKLSQMAIQLAEQRLELKRVLGTINALKAQLAIVTKQVKKVIVDVIEYGFFSLLAKANKRPKLVEKYMNMFLVSMNESLPEFLQPLSISVEKLLESEMAEKVIKKELSGNEIK